VYLAVRQPLPTWRVATLLLGARSPPSDTSRSPDRAACHA